MRFLDCRAGRKDPSKSILDVGVEEAIKFSGFDERMFFKRGGKYVWSKADMKLEWWYVTVFIPCNGGLAENLFYFYCCLYFNNRLKYLIELNSIFKFFSISSSCCSSSKKIFFIFYFKIHLKNIFYFIMYKAIISGGSELYYKLLLIY